MGHCKLMKAFTVADINYLWHFPLCPVSVFRCAVCERQPDIPQQVCHTGKVWHTSDAQLLCDVPFSGNKKWVIGALQIDESLYCG